MSIKIITGNPGAGKSLMTIKEAYEWLRTDNVFEWKNEETGETQEVKKQVFACNFNELNTQKTGFRIFEDPSKWKELPPGSLLIIDEAADYDFFTPHKVHETKPEALSDLRRHRHYGIDIWFIVQTPGMLDKYVRDLSESHWHYHRSNKTEQGYVYVSNTVFNPDQRKNSDAIPYRYKLDKKFFGTYKSSKLHIMKEEKPKVFYYAIFAAIATIAFSALSLFLITKPLREANKEKEEELYIDTIETEKIVYSDTPVNNTQLSNYRDNFKNQLEQNARIKELLTQEEYTKLFEPRFPTKPQTAPIFDEFTTKAKTFPKISGCSVTFRNVESCRCYTQQGTIYPVQTDICVRIASGNTPFDIYREQSTQNFRGKF